MGAALRIHSFLIVMDQTLIPFAASLAWASSGMLLWFNRRLALRVLWSLVATVAAGGAVFFLR